MSEKADYSYQPRPKSSPYANSAHDLAAQDVRGVLGPSHDADLLVSELVQRKAFGLQKYGVILHADNGRDHIRDALDEVVDLLVYLRAAREQSPELFLVLSSHYDNVVRVAGTLCGLHDFRKNNRE